MVEMQEQLEQVRHELAVTKQELRWLKEASQQKVLAINGAPVFGEAKFVSAFGGFGSGASAAEAGSTVFGTSVGKKPIA